MEAVPNNEKMSPDKNVTLLQLHKVISNHVEKGYISRLIDQQGDVNFIIPENSIFKVKHPALVGSTLLHFAFAEGNSYAFDYLLGKGADYTIKNAAGSTVLHKFIEEMLSDFLENNELRVENTFVDSIFQAHVRDKNFTNPYNRHGFSHFQAACATNNVEAIELFLKNGVSVDHAVNTDSPVFPGYAPLHFAARSGGAGAAETLLRYDSSLQGRDATGATPLYILIQRQLALIDERSVCEKHDEEIFAVIIERNESMIKLFLEFSENFENLNIDDSGLSKFHVACTMQDMSTVKCLLSKISDINNSVKNDSLFWPGYTALHFAALSNIDTVKLLLENGADIQAKNADGTSSFDICLERYGLNDISHIISCHPVWKNIQFLSSEVKLVNFIYALCKSSNLISMAQNFHTQSCLPLDSPLWPGSTPLHLAVILLQRPKAKFYTKESDDKEADSENDDDDDNESAINMIKLFYDTNYFRTVNVLAQDAYGRTPIHLAFRLQKRRILNLFFNQQQKIENPIDIDNVSLLHIACLKEREELVKELLFIGEDVNMPILCDLQATVIGIDIVSAESTPLHMALLTGNSQITDMLLVSGADPFVQDINGITPFHLVLTSGSPSLSRMFVSLTNVAVTGGVTCMHIACIGGDRAVVRKLIELGADVNATVNFGSETDNCSSKLAKLLKPHLGSTPLHYAFQYHCIYVAELLFCHGADLFTKRFEQPVPIVQILRKMCTRYTNLFLRNLRSNDVMQANLKNKTGLTLLHISCNALDIQLVRHSLSNGSDVNEQAHLDSPVWPGCTALHVLLENLKDRLDIHGNSRNRSIDNVHIVLKLLMSYNANTTLMNADKKTPIDISMELYRSHMRAKGWLCTMLPLGYHDYYDLTFVDNDGISPFQEACYQSNITVIEEFLKRGVDVNQRVDPFASKFANYTPLHFAAQQRWQSMIGSSRQLATLELLLNHGADIHAKDVDDNTPLHIAVQAGSSREKLISKLIKLGADMSALNMYGRTPLEVLLRSSNVSSAEVTVFLQNGARINSCNHITGASYIPLLYKVNVVKFDAIITAIIENDSDITAADEKGRTVIHNLVFNERGFPPCGLSSLCSRFVESGCDIDQQDESGKTALHLAVQSKYGDVTEHLLILNANTSIVDNEGKTAMDYALEKCNCQVPCDNLGHIQRLFALQAYKLELTGFQEFTEYRDLKKSFSNQRLIEDFRRNLKIAKETYIIPRELTLYDFASETGAISSYLHMPILKRNIIDEFFKSMKDEDPVTGSYVRFWLKNHYRKALARPSLIESAIHSFNSLIGFPFPHLCLDHILRFLNNTEMKYLIAAGAEDSDKG